jgi:hypothetical protein
MYIESTLHYFPPFGRKMGYMSGSFHGGSMSEQSPLILSGKEVAKSTLMRTRQKVQNMLAEGKEIGLCVVQVGECEASSIYVSRKEARAQKNWFRFHYLALA